MLSSLSLPLHPRKPWSYILQFLQSALNILPYITFQISNLDDKVTMISDSGPNLHVEIELDCAQDRINFKLKLHQALLSTLACKSWSLYRLNLKLE